MAVFRRLEQANLLHLNAKFNFKFNEKKKFPYLKVSDEVAFSVADILEEEGYSLTSSIYYSCPGEMFCSKSCSIQPSLKSLTEHS